MEAYEGIKYCVPRIYVAFVIAGQVPNVGQVLLHEQSGWRLEILEADEKRVTRIRLFAPVPDAEEEGE